MLHLLIAALLTLLAVPALAESKFMGLGDLPGGRFFSEALGISPDGSTIVGRSVSANGLEAFRWSISEGLVGLGDLSGGEFFSEARAASYDGSVIVGRARSATTDEAFRWTEPTGIVGIGGRSEAFDVSSDGSVLVGWREVPSTQEAFRWTEATGMVGLGTLPGDSQSYARAVSGDGNIVVGESNLEGFRWTLATGMEGLGDLQTTPERRVVSGAWGISTDGTYVVGGAHNEAGGVDPWEPYLWDAVNEMKGLGPCPSTLSNLQSSDVSADGTRVVGPPLYASNEAEAFIWDEENGCRLLKDALTNEFGLNLTGWTLHAATAISDDGNTIVGFGENPDGLQEAWVVYLAYERAIEALPIPIPSLPNLGITILILVILLAGAKFMRLHHA